MLLGNSKDTSDTRVPVSEQIRGAPKSSPNNEMTRVVVHFQSRPPLRSNQASPFGGVGFGNAPAPPGRGATLKRNSNGTAHPNYFSKTSKFFGIFIIMLLTLYLSGATFIKSDRQSKRRCLIQNVDMDNIQSIYESGTLVRRGRNWQYEGKQDNDNKATGIIIGYVTEAQKWIGSAQRAPNNFPEFPSHALVEWCHDGTKQWWYRIGAKDTSEDVPQFDLQVHENLEVTGTWFAGNEAIEIFEQEGVYYLTGYEETIIRYDNSNGSNDNFPYLYIYGEEEYRLKVTHRGIEFDDEDVWTRDPPEKTKVHEAAERSVTQIPPKMEQELEIEWISLRTDKVFTLRRGEQAQDPSYFYEIAYDAHDGQKRAEMTKQPHASKYTFMIKQGIKSYNVTLESGMLIINNGLGMYTNQDGDDCWIMKPDPLEDKELDAMDDEAPEVYRKWTVDCGYCMEYPKEICEELESTFDTLVQSNEAKVPVQVIPFENRYEDANTGERKRVVYAIILQREDGLGSMCPYLTCYPEGCMDGGKRFVIGHQYVVKGDEEFQERFLKNPTSILRKQDGINSRHIDYKSQRQVRRTKEFLENEEEEEEEEE